MKKNNVGYVFDPIMALHFEKDHPECPDRILEIFSELVVRKLIYSMTPVKTREATFNELEYGHDTVYISETEWKLRGPKNVMKQIEQEYNSVYVNEHTLLCAKLAVGSTIDLVKQVMNDNLDSGVAIVRPPGHHAERDMAMGFCIYNTVAICAKMLSREGKKVLIVDYDIHANNGTVDIVKSDTNILSFSVHRYDSGSFYPHTMLKNKTYFKKCNRDKRSMENIININLGGSITDKEYIGAFNNHLVERANNFQPDIVLVSAGFDGLEGDHLGRSNLTAECYVEMTNIIRKICPKIVMVLEGGYNVKSMADSFCKCVEVLLKN